MPLNRDSRTMSGVLLRLILCLPAFIGPAYSSPAEITTFADSLVSGETPEIADSLRVLEDAKGRALIESGRSLLDSGDLRGAESAFRQALFSKDKSLVVRARIGLGAVCRQRPGRRYEAVSHYRRALSLDPDNLEVYWELSRTGFELEETTGYRLASASLLEIIRRNPEHRGAYELWRDSIKDRNAGNLSRVGEYLRAWLPEHPKRGYWWLDLARDCYRLDDVPGAFACLDSLRVNWPQYRRSEQYLIEARCLLELGDTLGFEERYGSAIEVAGREGGFEQFSLDAQTIMRPEERRAWEGLKTPEQAAVLLRKFWMRRDPDPTTPANERLVEHYSRLAHAEKFYRQANPHSKFQTSSQYRKLVTPMAMNFEYDTDKVIPEIGSVMSLDQRGLLYVRHGAPKFISLPDDIAKSPDPTEIWQYDKISFTFVRKFGAGDFLFLPSRAVSNALATESFADPLPRMEFDYYGADFQGPGDRLEVEFYQSVPLDGSRDSPVSVVAVFDSVWAESVRDSAGCVLVKAPADTFWLAVHRLSLPPGDYFYATRMDVPGRRAAYRRELSLRTYSRDTLDVSGVVLGSPPGEGDAPLERFGVPLLPRPGLRFAPGEMISVYFEVYGLKADSGGRRAWSERVTVTAAGESGGGGIKRLFGFGGRERRSISLTFDREPEGTEGPAAENFVIDTANLDPGRYRLRLEITDRVSGDSKRIDWFFELAYPKGQ